jgi:hypothetical protein
VEGLISVQLPQDSSHFGPEQFYKYILKFLLNSVKGQSVNMANYTVLIYCSSGTQENRNPLLVHSLLLPRMGPRNKSQMNSEAHRGQDSEQKIVKQDMLSLGIK